MALTADDAFVAGMSSVRNAQQAALGQVMQAYMHAGVHLLCIRVQSSGPRSD